MQATISSEISNFNVNPYSESGKFRNYRGKSRIISGKLRIDGYLDSCHRAKVQRYDQFTFDYTHEFVAVTFLNIC